MDHPKVLEGYKPRVDHKRRAPAALCLNEELEGSCQDLGLSRGLLLAWRRKCSHQLLHRTHRCLLTACTCQGNTANP